MVCEVPSTAVGEVGFAPAGGALLACDVVAGELWSAGACDDVAKIAKRFCGDGCGSWVGSCRSSPLPVISKCDLAVVTAGELFSAGAGVGAAMIAEHFREDGCGSGVGSTRSSHPPVISECGLVVGDLLGSGWWRIHCEVGVFKTCCCTAWVHLDLYVNGSEVVRKASEVGNFCTRQLRVGQLATWSAGKAAVPQRPGSSRAATRRRQRFPRGAGCRSFSLSCGRLGGCELGRRGAPRGLRGFLGTLRSWCGEGLLLFAVPS
jgi:hypothetical protein